MKRLARLIVGIVFVSYVLLMLWLLFGQRRGYYDIPGTYLGKAAI